ncbi:MAG: DNA adenine methylase [Planctomycetaceae bacterium]
MELLTFKYNVKSGRHGWLRLTPAYSLKIVEELVTRLPTSRRIYDPFCGTGTTALSAAYHGHEGITTDINPYLVWLAEAKTVDYSTRTLNATEKYCDAAIDLVDRQRVEPVDAPPIHNITRWWAPKALEFLCALRSAIEQVTRKGTPSHSLLLIAFCRTLIDLSNAAFNHQSMSFGDKTHPTLDFGDTFSTRYRDDVAFVLRGAAENPAGKATVLLGDARDPSLVVEGPIDLVITSPPYANRMSYIRELRPYMYWLDYLHNGRDAGELDWSAIGGTWGIATSRLAEWNRPESKCDSHELQAAVEAIAHADNKNGAVLANYVAKYFDDMWAHFSGLVKVLGSGAEVHYVVGNSTFYGTLVSTEQLYAQMMKSVGFVDVKCHPLRKRNSKKELVEFDVVAKWPG